MGHRIAGPFWSILSANAAAMGPHPVIPLVTRVDEPQSA